MAALVLSTQNAQAGRAAFASVLAGSAQRRLDFTRQNELEADRVGIQLLEQAGFDPRSMPNFFERMAQSNRYYTEPPEFLACIPSQACGDAISYFCQMNGNNTKYWEVIDTCGPPLFEPCDSPGDIDGPC